MTAGVEQSYTKFFCENCGKWIGVFDNKHSLEGIFPYCSRCKKAVPVTSHSVQSKNYEKHK